LRQRAWSRAIDFAPRWEVILVHLPVHARWLNQIEIYYSIFQRKLSE